MDNVLIVNEQVIDDRFTCDHQHPTASWPRCTMRLFHKGDHNKFNALGQSVVSWSQEKTTDEQ